MTGVMGSSSPYLKLVSCRDKNIGFLCLRDDLLGKSLMGSPLRRCRNNQKSKDVDFKLSISVSSTHRGFRPTSLSSSDTQTAVESHEMHIEQSPNGHTIEAEAEAQTVGVKFQLQRECSFGQHFLIVGDDPMLGFWDPNNAIPLTWSDGHVWTVDLDIPIGKCIKFKFIMQESNGNLIWQPGPDRILECWGTDKIITLCEDWENPDSRRIIDADPRSNQVQGLGSSPEMQMDAAYEVIPVEPSTGTSKSGNKTQTEEPNGYATNVNQVLASDEPVPVLVPGLGRLPTTDTDEEASVNEASKDEPESMIATVVDMAMDLKLPEAEFDSNPRPVTPSMLENQDSCENEHQVAEEQDHQTTQPMKGLLLDDFHWGNKVMQKLLGIFGIQ